MTDVLLELRRRRLEAGERPLGWKLGFGAPAALEQLGISAPLVGFLTDATLLESGATVPIGDWTKAQLEPELAVRVGERGAVAGFAVAIELADVDFPPADPESILAGNVYHRGLVLGPVDEDRRTVEGIAFRVTRNGEEVAATRDPEALTGPTEELVRVVAETVGGELRPGDVVITGSVVPPLLVRPGDDVRVEADPLGALELHFS